LNRELTTAIAGAFLPAKRTPGEDVEEDFRGETPGPETLGWEFEQYWKYLARHQARVARRLGVALDVLDEIDIEFECSTGPEKPSGT
jgi:hypothetical protein